MTNCNKIETSDCELEMTINIEFKEELPKHVFIDIANRHHSERLQCGIAIAEKCTQSSWHGE